MRGGAGHRTSRRDRVRALPRFATSSRFSFSSPGIIAQLQISASPPLHCVPSSTIYLSLCLFHSLLVRRRRRGQWSLDHCAVSAFCIARSPGTESARYPPPYVCACIFGGEQIDRLRRPLFLAVVSRARPCDYSRRRSDVRQRVVAHVTGHFSFGIIAVELAPFESVSIALHITSRSPSIPSTLGLISIPVQTRRA